MRCLMHIYMMDAHTRNRRPPPSPELGDGNFSRQRSNASSGSVTVGPMNLGGSVPPLAIRRNATPPQSTPFTNSARQASRGLVASTPYAASKSPDMAGHTPKLNIFANSQHVNGAPKPQGLQDYLDGGVQSFPQEVHIMKSQAEAVMPIAAYGIQTVKMDSYKGSQLSSPFSQQPSNAGWQPMRTLRISKPSKLAEEGECVYANAHSTGIGFKQNEVQEAGPFSIANALGFQGGFAEQLKQIGEIYSSNQQVEEELLDPPLLEELGIDVDDIIRHIKCVLLFKMYVEPPQISRSCSSENGDLQYADFTGPVFILLLLALSLLISCNLNFSLVYVIEVVGTWFMYLLLNLISQDVYIDVTKTAIVLGYSLLPICLTPLLWLFSRFAKPVAIVLIYLCVAWSTSTASLLLTQELNMSRRKYLIIYPTLLYYLFFAQVAMSRS